MEEHLLKTFLHYNPERIDYTLTPGELEQLREAGQNSWKDFCLACFGVGLPCLINAVAECAQQKPFKATLTFNVNLVFGLVGIVLGAAFAVAWRNTRQRIDELVDKIRKKPKMPVSPGPLDVGKIALMLPKTEDE